MSTPTYKYDQLALEKRKSDNEIHPILLSRRSPKRITTEPISDNELRSLFEAARWAPSYHNSQPWRFVYAKKETKHWNKLFDLLWPLNRVWVKDAAVIGIILSSKYFMKNGKKLESPCHEYDTGSAWMSLAIEGSTRGLCIRGLGGFDYDRAAQTLNINKETHKICAMFCIAKRDVPSENDHVSQREPIEKFIFEGDFVNSDIF